MAKELKRGAQSYLQTRLGIFFDGPLASGLDISDIPLYLNTLRKKKCTTDIPITSATAVASAA